MDNFFAQFDSQESVAILFFLLLAFLFGLAIGYLLRSRRIKMIRAALNDNEKELAESEQRVFALKNQLDLLNADLKKAMFEAEEQVARALRLEEENTRQYHEMLTLNEEIERLNADNKSLIAHIDDLNNQILGLKARTADAAAPLAISSSSDPAQPALTSSIHRLESLVEQLSRIETENAGLKIALAQAIEKAGQLAPAPAPSGSTSIAFDIPAVEEPELVFQKDKNVLQDKIIIHEQEMPKDDLTLIEGVGPFLAQKLHEQGVYTFEQIGTWDAADIGQITAAIGYFPGRIERDNWVGQALELARLKMENPEALKAAPGATRRDPNDLKVIEGIGPKIEELLHQAGIHTLEGLAECPVERLEHILEEAGGHFRMHTPDTWPAQARLAANGDWELLQEYQDQLKGGREMDET